MSVVDNKTVDGVALTDDKNGILRKSRLNCWIHMYPTIQSALA